MKFGTLKLRFWSEKQQKSSTLPHTFEKIRKNYIFEERNVATMLNCLTLKMAKKWPKNAKSSTLSTLPHTFSVEEKIEKIVKKGRFWAIFGSKN